MFYLFQYSLSINTYDPRHFVMKLDGANIIQVAMKSKETPSILRPNIWRISVTEVSANDK